MSNLVDIKIVANANFAPVYAELGKLKAAMASLSSTAGTAGVSKNLAAGLKAAEVQMLKGVAATKAYSVETVALSSATDVLTKKLVQGKFHLGEYMKMWGNQKKIIPELNQIAQAQARVMQSLIIPSSTREGMAHVVTSLKGMKNASLEAAIYQKALNSALHQGATSLINFGKNTQWAGRQLTAGLTMPVMLAAGAISKVFYDVDKELTKLGRVYGAGITGATTKQIETIKSQVLDLSRVMSKSLGISAKEVAGLAAEFAQAGQQGNQLLESTRQASKIMVLGEVDKQEAVKATISVQNTYKLSNQELADSINFLNTVQDSTSVSFQDLIDSVPRVGPIIKNLGGSYKDVAAMLVAMKEGGVAASEGANALKNSFGRMINPTKSASDMLKGLGINIQEIVAKNIGKPIQLIEDLQVALDKLDPLKRSQAIAELFGKFQFARMTALFDNFNRAGSQSRQAMALMGASSKELEDTTSRHIKKIQESVSGRFKIAIESLKSSLLPLGKQFLKIFTVIIEGVTKVVKWFDRLGMMKNILVALVGGGMIIGPITMIVGLFANLAGQILKGVNYMRMFRQGFKSAIGEGFFAGISGGIKNLTNWFEQADKAQLASKALADQTVQSVEKQESAISSLTRVIAMYRSEVDRLIATQAGVGAAAGLRLFPTAGPLSPAGLLGATGAYGQPLVTNMSSAIRSRKGFESNGRYVEMLHYTPFLETAQGTDILGQGGGYQARNALGTAAIFPALMAEQGSNVQNLNQIIGSKQMPTLSPRMMNEENLAAIMGYHNIPMNAANVAAAKEAFSLETISSHETGKITTLMAMQSLSEGQRGQLKSLAGEHGTGSEQVVSYLKSALGPEYEKLNQAVAKDVIGMYERAEKEVLAHPEFATAGVAEQVNAISGRYGELLREKYKSIFETLDAEILNSITVRISVPLEQAKDAIMEAARKNVYARIPNLVSSCQSSAMSIMRVFEELAARLAIASEEIAATVAGGAGPSAAASRLRGMSFGRPLLRAGGGKITGPGGPTDDVIPAMLSHGEYVIKASSVNKYGTGFLDAVNSGKYANGGIIKLHEGAYVHKNPHLYEKNYYKFMDEFTSQGRFQRGHHFGVGSGFLTSHMTGLTSYVPEEVNQLFRNLTDAYTRALPDSNFQKLLDRHKSIESILVTRGQPLSFSEYQSSLPFLKDLDVLLQKEKVLGIGPETVSRYIPKSLEFFSLMTNEGVNSFKEKLKYLLLAASDKTNQTRIFSKSNKYPYGFDKEKLNSAIDNISENSTSTEIQKQLLSARVKGIPRGASNWLKFLSKRGRANGGLIRGFNAGGMEGSFIPHPEIDGVAVTPFIEANLKHALQSPMYSKSMNRILSTPGEFKKWVERLENALATWTSKKWARQAEFIDPYAMITPQGAGRLDKELMMHTKRDMDAREVRKRIEAQIAEGIRPRYYTDILGNDTPYRQWLSEFGTTEQIQRYMRGRTIRFKLPPIEPFASGGIAKLAGGGLPWLEAEEAIMSKSKGAARGFQTGVSEGFIAKGAEGIERYIKPTGSSAIGEYITSRIYKALGVPATEFKFLNYSKYLDKINPQTLEGLALASEIKPGLLDLTQIKKMALAEGMDDTHFKNLLRMKMYDYLAHDTVIGLSDIKLANLLGQSMLKGQVSRLDMGLGTIPSIFKSGELLGNKPYGSQYDLITSIKSNTKPNMPQHIEWKAIEALKKTMPILGDKVRSAGGFNAIVNGAVQEVIAVLSKQGVDSEVLSEIARKGSLTSTALNNSYNEIANLYGMPKFANGGIAKLAFGSPIPPKSLINEWVSSGQQTIRNSRPLYKQFTKMMGSLREGMALYRGAVLNPGVSQELSLAQQRKIIEGIRNKDASALMGMRLDFNGPYSFTQQPFHAETKSGFNAAAFMKASLKRHQAGAAGATTTNYAAGELRLGRDQDSPIMPGKYGYEPVLFKFIAGKKTKGLQVLTGQEKHGLEETVLHNSSGKIVGLAKDKATGATIITIQGFNSGGKIYGAGGPTDDKIPALLSNGEYVVKADSVAKYGTGFMDSINAGRFANGGIAGYSGGSGVPPRVFQVPFLGGLTGGKIDSLEQTFVRLKLVVEGGVQRLKEWNFGIGKTQRLIKDYSIETAKGTSVVKSFFRGLESSRPMYGNARESFVSTNSSENAGFRAGMNVMGLPQTVKNKFSNMISAAKDKIKVNSALSTSGPMYGPMTREQALANMGPSGPMYGPMTREQALANMGPFARYKANRAAMTPEQRMMMGQKSMMIGMGAGMIAPMASTMIHGEGAGSGAARSGLQMGGMAAMMLPMFGMAGGPLAGAALAIAGVAAVFSYFSAKAKEARERAKDLAAVTKESYSISASEAAAFGIKIKDLATTIKGTQTFIDQYKTSIEQYKQSISSQVQSNDDMKRTMEQLTIAYKQGDQSFNTILNNFYQKLILLGQSAPEAQKTIQAMAEMSGYQGNLPVLAAQNPESILAQRYRSGNKNTFGMGLAQLILNPSSNQKSIQGLLSSIGVSKQTTGFGVSLIENLKKGGMSDLATSILRKAGGSYINGGNVSRLGDAITMINQGMMNIDQYVEYMSGIGNTVDEFNKKFKGKQAAITIISAYIQKIVNSLSQTSPSIAKEKLIKQYQNEIKQNEKKIKQEEKILNKRNQEYDALSKSIEQRQTLSNLNADVVKARAGGNLIDIAMAEQAQISGAAQIARERAKDAADAINQKNIETLNDTNESLNNKITGLQKWLENNSDATNKNTDIMNKLSGLTALATRGDISSSGFKDWLKDRGGLGVLNTKSAQEQYLAEASGLTTGQVQRYGLQSQFSGILSDEYSLPTTGNAVLRGGNYPSKPWNKNHLNYQIKNGVLMYQNSSDKKWSPVPEPIKGKEQQFTSGYSMSGQPIYTVIPKEIRQKANAYLSGQGLAYGGYISGPGGPKSDMIPAMLSNGEYVVRASSVAKYGSQF
ncbi:MAG: phage tail tape measure protein, partial [Alphaproteobacteria bacterium]|nr:phage tail tape measure protein [Alphaproteobacteria bacterium]